LLPRRVYLYINTPTIAVRMATIIVIINVAVL
jgi:hypothetical protein